MRVPTIKLLHMTEPTIKLRLLYPVGKKGPHWCAVISWEEHEEGYETYEVGDTPAEAVAKLIQKVKSRPLLVHRLKLMRDSFSDPDGCRYMKTPRE
jgi:hypothetical protein